MKKEDLFIINGNKKVVYMVANILRDEDGERIIIYLDKNNTKMVLEKDCQFVNLKKIKVRDFKGEYWYKIDDNKNFFIGSDLKPDFLSITLEGYLNNTITVLAD